MNKLFKQVGPFWAAPDLLFNLGIFSIFRDEFFCGLFAVLISVKKFQIPEFISVLFNEFITAALQIIVVSIRFIFFKRLGGICAGHQV